MSSCLIAALKPPKIFAPLSLRQCPSARPHEGATLRTQGPMVSLHRAPKFLRLQSRTQERDFPRNSIIAGFGPRLYRSPARRA